MFPFHFILILSIQPIHPLHWDQTSLAMPMNQAGPTRVLSFGALKIYIICIL